MIEIKQTIQVEGLSEDDKHVLHNFVEALAGFCRSRDCEDCALGKTHENNLCTNCPTAILDIFGTLGI